MNAATERRPRVVIVGAGFGGLEAARALARSPCDVTIVDRHNYHCFQPLLYQVATAALSPADIAWPIRRILRRQSNATVLMAEVTGVDWRAKDVLLGERRLPYDHLVIAAGATHSYFGNDDWARFAPGLKSIEDATRIRAALLIAFERAELQEQPAQRRRLLTFAVVGGGPTGVEMAGAIAEVARQALRNDFCRIDPMEARILLIEAGERILSGLPEDLSAYAQRTLERMGVEVRLNAPVTACEAAGIRLGEEAIETATIIWAAGVRASPAAHWLDARSDRAGRIMVGQDLSVPDREGVYAIGDTAAIAEPVGRAPPGIAPAAKQMGSHAGRTIAAAIAGAPAPGPFVYRHRGDLATIGRKAAVVKLDRVKLKGFIGWLFWSVAHVYFLIGARNRLVVAYTWAWNYLTYQRGARLITRTPPAEVAATQEAAKARPAAADPSG